MTSPRATGSSPPDCPGGAKVGYHPETGRVRFISGSSSMPLSAELPGVAAGKRTLAAADARTAARRFVERYGPMFGLRDAARELRVKATERRLAPAAGLASVAAGRPNATVRFEQVREGVPVMGGEIAVQLSDTGEVLSAAGEVLPSAATTPSAARIGRAAARRAAAAWVAREAGRPASSVRTTAEGLGVYDPRIMDDPVLAAAGTRLVWQIDARVPASARKPADHRLVLVDALGGDVLTTISRVYTAEGPNRRVCDNRSIARSQLGLRLTLRAQRGPAAKRHPRSGCGLPCHGCGLRLLLPAVRTRRHRRQGLAHEGHRTLLPQLLPLAQRGVEVGRAAGHLRDRLDQG